MQHVTITAAGTYAASTIKPELVESLRASIEQHMKAYGLKEIEITARVCGCRKKAEVA